MGLVQTFCLHDNFSDSNNAEEIEAHVVIDYKMLFSFQICDVFQNYVQICI
jgi:hypothetical protein